MELVSVIIPTYNRAHLVSDAISSVLKQTYKNYEILVIDDGSTDETEHVLKQFNDKIRYIYQENKGAGAARNHGLKEAKGSYIAFLDSDDLWLDFKLELQVAIMDRLPEIGFLSTEFCIMRDSGERIDNALRTWHQKIKPWEEVYDKSVRYSELNIDVATPIRDFTIFIGNIYYDLLIDPYVLPSSAILRSNRLTGEIKFAEGTPVYEDWEFFARLSRDNISAFLNIETTINRGHTDKVRLTRCSLKTKAENRIGLIRRVWKSDAEFNNKYDKDISKVEGEEIIILAKQLLLESKIGDARRILKQWTKLGLTNRNKYVLFLKLCTYIPGSTWLIHIIRNLRKNKW